MNEPKVNAWGHGIACQCIDCRLATALATVVELRSALEFVRYYIRDKNVLDPMKGSDDAAAFNAIMSRIDDALAGRSLPLLILSSSSADRSRR